MRRGAQAPALRARYLGCMGEFHVKKIILPSGKAVEIVYFHAEAVAEPELEDALAGSTEGLELCASCGSDLVHPTDWREAPDGRWELQLRCPECEWTHGGTYDQDTVERFDMQLNAATDELIDALEQATRENMESDIERFVHALEHGHIQPFDF